MKTIIVDGRPLDGTRNGFAAYTEWVISVLQSKGFDVSLASNHPVKFASYSSIKPCPVDVFGSKKSLRWEQVDLRSYLAKTRPDIYFCGQNIGLPLLYSGPTRLVLGLLDMIPQKFPRHYIRTSRDKLRYRLMQRANARKADQIVTISESSKTDIKSIMGVESVEAVYIRQKFPARQLSRLLPSRPVFVYVGGVEWRKRLDVAIQAFELFHIKHPDARLVIIGDGYDEAMHEVASSKLKQSIIFTGVLSVAARNAQIRKATAVVSPSLYEGYGLPIAESLLQGIPVICGPDGSQSEVGGKAALYVDPTDEHSVVAAMEEVNSSKYRKNFYRRLPAQVGFLCDPRYDDLLVAAIVGKS